jgi:hypothetical protein
VRWTDCCEEVPDLRGRDNRRARAGDRVESDLRDSDDNCMTEAEAMLERITMELPTIEGLDRT